MKTVIRVPTVQYGYIEIEADVATSLDAIDIHNTLLKLYKGSTDADESLKTSENW